MSISGLNHSENPYIIGIVGPSCSGKTTVCDIITDMFKKDDNSPVTIISQDRYYKGGDTKTNFDHPDAIDFEMMENDINKLKRGEQIEAPNYDFTTHKRTSKKTIIHPTSIIIVEGVLIFNSEALRDLFDLKVYVNALRELRYERRMTRDVEERGRDTLEVRTRYFRDVLPSNDHFVEPTMWYSDIVLMNNKNIDKQFIGIDILVDHIHKKVDTNIIKKE